MVEQVGFSVIFEAGLLQILILSYRQIFPLYLDAERLPSKNSAFARIRQKRAEYKARFIEGAVLAEPIAGSSVV